jgi:hypothetical protein
LDGTKTHKLVLEGLFGPVYKVTTTKQLMDNDQLAELKIFGLVLQYPDDVKKACKDNKYPDEMSFLCGYEPRNKFIRNLALSQTGNSLVLFQYVEKHGQILFDMIKAKAGDRKVFFVFGGTETADREDIRRITDQHKEGILLTLGKVQLLLPHSLEVKLTNLSIKLASKISCDDDICDKWLSENYKRYKYL